MDHVPGEVLVMFKPGVSLKHKMPLIIAMGGDQYQELSFKNMTRVVLESGATIAEALDLCAKSPLVLYAQMNFVYRAQALPDDPLFHRQWSVEKNTSTDGDETVGATDSLCRDDLENAWDIIHDCRDITVAILDTGINYGHQDLETNMWNGAEEGLLLHGYDFVDEDDDPMDLNGHGTHLAGIIGAAGNNGVGVAGLCWTVSLMAVRVLDEAGRGTTADIVQGIAFAAENSAHIATMGFGAEVPFDRAMSQALDLTLKADMAVIAAAGNGDLEDTGHDNDRGGSDGDTVTSFYPCSFRHENLACVAALDFRGSLAPFSNYGAQKVHLAAPGWEILSTAAGTTETITDDLKQGWSRTGAWRNETVDLGFGSYSMLINPEDWDRGSYADGADDRAWKHYDLSAYDAALLGFHAFVNTEDTFDYLRVIAGSTGENPFTDGWELDLIHGHSGDTAYRFTYGVNQSLSKTGSVGFHLVSDGETGDSGVGIFNLEITGLKLGAAEYARLSGTSQSAAHACGITAMVMALNDQYGGRDALRALKQGAATDPLLKKKISGGKSADVYGSLLYIDRPRGLKAEPLR
jgi:subtilisin family serine protease